MPGVRALSRCVHSTDGLGIAFHCFSQDFGFHPGERRDQLDTPERSSAQLLNLSSQPPFLWCVALQVLVREL